MSLRLIPGLDVWRPGDETETAMAWTQALLRAHGPSALLLSRQALPACARTAEQVAAIGRGGYVLADRPNASVVIVATGSEVSLALAAQQQLDARGIAARVVSLPSTTVFDRQERSYRREVLMSDAPVLRVAVEAGSTRGWADYGCQAALGLDRYGESGPGPAVMAHFGFTPEALVALVVGELERQGAA